MLPPTYIAGLFDGEGSVSLIYTVRRRRRNDEIPILGFKFVVLLGNTHRGILDSLQCQYSGYIHPNWHGAPTNRKPMWTWRLTTFETQYRFLVDIEPHCIIKEEAVRLGLRYLSTAKRQGLRTSPDDWVTRVEVYRALTVVNQRGTTPKKKRETPVDPPEGWRPSRRFTPTELHEPMNRMRTCRFHQ